MRSRVVRRRDVPLLVNMTIALAVVGTVTFFILVMEYCVGQGELTQAELRLINADVRISNTTAPLSDDKKQNWEDKESKNGKWWSTQPIP